MTKRTRVDVVVIGAGVSGLAAAWRLHQQGITDVRVLEARSRVGGRTLTEHAEGGLPIDVGAQWVGPTQTRILALADELQLRTFPSPVSGRHIMLLDGRIYPYRGLFPLRRTRVGLDFVMAAARLELASRRVPIDAPCSAPDARALDEQSFGDWLRRHLKTPQARALFEIVSGLTLGGDPDDLSLLWVLHHVRTAGGLAPLISVKGGAQDRRFAEGAQSVSLSLADRLASSVQLDSPVQRITWRADGASVHCSGQVIEARRVIVAMSPADRQRLAFDPPLPHSVACLQSRMSLFKGFKIQLVYAEPFWRSAGLSGQALGDSGIAPLAFDNSHPDRPEGVLVTFVAGKEGPSPLMPTAEQLADAHVRRQAVIVCMVAYFGEQARHPIAYVEKDWRDEPWSAGCIPAMAPGVMTDAGASAYEDVGPLIWAGTEMADRWGGYMEGAVRSGERAAKAAHAH